MKKMFIFALCGLKICVVSGMEKDNVWRMIEFATSPKICLVQDKEYGTNSERADILVLGAVEQKKFADAKKGTYDPVGTVTCFYADNTPVKQNSCESLEGKEKRRRTLPIKKTSKDTMESVRSLENRKKFQATVYVVEPYSLFKNINYVDSMAKVDNIWQDAEKDLRGCYVNVLDRAHTYFTMDNTARSIALPTLGVSSGFLINKVAHVAVASVIEFINNSLYRDRYMLIEFVVKNKKDFLLYWDVLEKHKIPFLSYHDKEIVKTSPRQS